MQCGWKVLSSTWYTVSLVAHRVQNEHGRKGGVVDVVSERLMGEGFNQKE